MLWEVESICPHVCGTQWQIFLTLYLECKTPCSKNIKRFYWKKHPIMMKYVCFFHFKSQKYSKKVFYLHLTIFLNQKSRSRFVLIGNILWRCNAHTFTILVFHLMTASWQRDGNSTNSIFRSREQKCKTFCIFRIILLLR